MFPGSRYPISVFPGSRYNVFPGSRYNNNNRSPGIFCVMRDTLVSSNVLLHLNIVSTFSIAHDCTGTASLSLAAVVVVVVVVIIIGYYL